MARLRNSDSGSRIYAYDYPYDPESGLSSFDDHRSDGAGRTYADRVLLDSGFVVFDECGDDCPGWLDGSTNQDDESMIRWGDDVIAPLGNGWVWGQAEGNAFKNHDGELIVGIENGGCTDVEYETCTKVFVLATTVTKLN